MPTPYRTFCLLALLVLVLPTAGEAQEPGSFRLTADHLEGARRIDLSRVPWRYRAGDDPAWADPSLDDSGWGLLPPTVKLDSLPEGTWSGIGWYRLHLSVDSTLRNTTLALSMDHFGASEVYLDGKLVHRFGTVGTAGEEERTGYSLQLPVGLHLDGGAEHLLAVRYSFAEGSKLTARFGKLLHFDVGFFVWLGALDEQVRTYVRAFNAMTGASGAFFGILILMTFLHLMLFVFFERDRSNLYFSLYTACVLGVVVISGYLVYFPPNIGLALVLGLSFPLVACSGMIALLAVLYSLFHGRLPRRLWLLWGGTTLLILAGTVLQQGWLFFLSWTLVFLESLHVAGRALWNRREGAWIIGLGVLGFVLSVVGSQLQGSPATPTHLAPTALEFLLAAGIYLSMPVAMSVFLARRFARTNRHLEVRLKQVEQLSARAVAQEQEQKRLIEQQNERLEREVAERTTELQQSLEHLKATQAQLVQQEKLASLGALTAGIAHEIKNPLNFVNNFAALSADLTRELAEELAKRPGPSGEAGPDPVGELLADLRANADKIVAHGRRADSIVKNMLLHSRSSIGRREPTDVNALVDENVNLAYHSMRAQRTDFDCRLETRYDPAVGRVEMIPQEMGRVLLNLVGNALDAVAEQKGRLGARYEPRVVVSTGCVGEQVEIRVEDNGPGIGPAIREKIFEPFFTTKPPGAGTGLGLSLSHDVVVEGHQGALRVESEVDRGASFVILLPR